MRYMVAPSSMGVAWTLIQFFGRNHVEIGGWMEPSFVHDIFHEDATALAGLLSEYDVNVYDEKYSRVSGE